MSVAAWSGSGGLLFAIQHPYRLTFTPTFRVPPRLPPLPPLRAVVPPSSPRKSCSPQHTAWVMRREAWCGAGWPCCAAQYALGPAAAPPSSAASAKSCWCACCRSCWEEEGLGLCVCNHRRGSGGGSMCVSGALCLEWQAAAVPPFASAVLGAAVGSCAATTHAPSTPSLPPAITAATRL